MISLQLNPCAHAQSITDRLTGSPRVPWHISADTIGYNATTTTYHAKGNVIIEKEGARLVADSVAFNNKEMTASATGHILMTVGDDVLTGNRVELDLGRETGVLHEGTVFLKKSHFYIHGDRIEKTGKDTYRAENGDITTCDGDRPDWRIHGRTVEVTVEGYGTATHATFKARNVPVLYVPYILFPVKTKRQTGLLLPEAGASDRKGLNWDQPLFLAINDNTDATVTAHYMEKRGTKVGLEYRYALTDKSNGTLMVDGLDDRQIDDGTPESTAQWGYFGDDYDRPNTDRYWLRAKLDQELPWGAAANLDLDIVSDQDYLTEFRDGRSGYYESRDSFRKTFGRDLDTYDESTRTNRLNINRNWSTFTLNGDLIWNDNVINRRWEETDETLQRLPLIQFDGAKQPVLGSPFFWNLNSEYVYLFELDGEQGHRTDIYPRIYLPVKWNNYLSVEPSAGWRHTAWAMDRQEDETADRSSYRQIYDASLDLSTEFSKVMNSPIGAADRIRHSFRPRVVYTYTPNQDQSDLPDFDTNIDRIDAANEITYSLVNLFTTRKGKKARTETLTDKATGLTESGKPPEPKLWNREAEETTGRLDQNIQVTPAMFDYNRFCRFNLAQTYDIDSAGEIDSKPFSDILAELDINFGRYLAIDSEGQFDVYEGLFSSHNIVAAMMDRRGDRLWITHSYVKDSNESINARVAIRLTDHLTIRGEYERNLLANVDISKGAGFLYASQCWSFDFFYAVEGNNNSFNFMINLMGIGGFGQ